MTPLMNATGMNTAARMRAIATTGPCTSDIAWRVASRGAIPSSMWCSTASTTTMASSTTRPMARTSPKSESVLTEKPRSGKTANAPTSETGTVRSGMSVARQLWRKTKTTSDDEANRFEQRLDDLANAGLDGRGRVERHLVVDARREVRLQLLHRLADVVGDVEGVRPGRLERGDDRGGLAVERAVLLVVERRRARCARRP